MEEQLISFDTAKLAKEKGFNLAVRSAFIEEKLHQDINTKGNYNDVNWVRTWRNSPNDDTLSAPTQSLLQKWLRENRGVHISIYKNASGYLWTIMKVEGGTDLGYSDLSGNDEDSGTFTTYEKCLEDILALCLKATLEEFRSDDEFGKHWGNYADYLKQLKK